MERLIDILIFLADRSLALRGSSKIFGSRHNGNFLGLFDLLVKRNPVLNDLQNRINWHKSKQHNLSKNIENELIKVIAKEAKKVLITQVEQAKYFAVILDCTPDFSH